MPKKPILDKISLQANILSYINQHGPTPPKLLCKQFNISQPSLYRILDSLKNELMFIGEGKNRHYAALRKIEGVLTPIVIYQVFENGNCQQFGILHPLKPQFFYFEAKNHYAKSAIYPDLPYFLNDLRPNGFLGRLIPRQHSDLNLPRDILAWNANHTIKYLSQHAWNNIGDLVLGENSFQLFLEKTQSKIKGIASKNRKNKYPLYANDVLISGEAGSFAGGGQPKFITTLLPANKPVIVKFSPQINSDLSQRVADILICEHLALNILKKHLCDAADSKVFCYDKRIFLEITRFDRIGKFGRRGLISLGTLDAQFTAEISTWSKTAAALIKNKILAADLFEKILFREIFGGLIANNDMHLYNLSFFINGEIITGLAPVYDMSPMLFMPRNNQIIQKEFTPPLPLPENAKIWSAAYAAAKEFWDSVLIDKNISVGFKKIAKNCKSSLSQLDKITKRFK